MASPDRLLSNVFLWRYKRLDRPIQTDDEWADFIQHNVGCVRNARPPFLAGLHATSLRQMGF